MIPRRIDNDEPDVIDLTASYGYYGSLYFPIRPPSPFADRPTRSQTLSLRYENIHSMENTVRSSTPTNLTNTLRRKLNKLLKHTKSNKHKKVVTSDQTRPYDFGNGETSRSRSSNKRVHWIDDDETILNASHRFIEYLKLFVRNQIEDRSVNDNYLKQCQIALNELDSIVDCQKIRVAFDDLIQFSKLHDKTRLHEQGIYIENLISHTVLFSSA